MRISARLRRSIRRLGMFVLVASLGGCGVNAPNMPPGSIPDAAIPGINGNTSIGTQAELVLTIARQTQPIAQRIYQKRAAGTDNDAEMEHLRRQIMPIWYQLGSSAAELYHTATLSPDATVAASGKHFARAAFDLARCQDELANLFLGYTIAERELNPKFATAKEKYTNALSDKCDQLFTRFSAAADELSTSIATETASGNKFDAGGSPMEAAGGPAAITVDGDAKAVALVRPLLAKSAGDTALAHEPEARVEVKISELEGGEVNSGSLIAIAILPIPSSSYSAVFGGGDASFSAQLVMADGKPIDLRVNTYEILARNKTTLAGLIATRIAGAAHFALLAHETGID